MSKNRSIFDVVGPVMIGPSSSHTAGAVRLGSLARSVLGETPASATIKLHGSFARTGPGHGTDLALIAGLLGFSPDDERIIDAFTLAKKADLDYRFVDEDLEGVHPNTALFSLVSHSGQTLTVRGSSLGGGSVVIDRIGSYEVEITGDYPTVLVVHTDQPGQITRISGMIADANVNIASMRVSREHKGSRALMILEVDEPIDKVTASRILKQVGVEEVRLIPKI